MTIKPANNPQRVSKRELIKAMSEETRSLARQLEKDMSLKSVQVGDKIWLK